MKIKEPLQCSLDRRILEQYKQVMMKGIPMWLLFTFTPDDIETL